MNLKLFGNGILIKPDGGDDKEHKTKSGIIILTPTGSEKQFAIGTVVSYGIDCTDKVKAGDRVYYSQLQAGEFEYNNEKYDMIQESSLIGVFV